MDSLQVVMKSDRLVFFQGSGHDHVPFLSLGRREFKGNALFLHELRKEFEVLPKQDSIHASRPGMDFVQVVLKCFVPIFYRSLTRDGALDSWHFSFSRLLAATSPRRSGAAIGRQ